MKKVLFVTYDFPYPTNSGGKNRAYHMLKFSGPEFKKYLFSFVRPDFKKEYIKEMNKAGVEVLDVVPRRKTADLRNMIGLLSSKSIFKTLYYSDSVLAKLISAIGNYEIDIVHFESFYTAFYICDAIRDLGAKQIYGTENIEFRLYEDYAKKMPFFLKPLYDAQVERVKKEEERMYKDADVTLAVSDEEAELIKKYARECEIIRNGVDLEDFPYKKPKNIQGKNLLFVGNFTYFPNVDAINYFVKEVFYKLPPTINLTIIGKKAQSLPFAKDGRIEAIEFIPKIQDAYERADLVVAPVRLGGGTNFKVLEAMASGTPVVSLAARLEGLKLENGQHIAVVENAEEFISTINELLGNLSKRVKLSKGARALVEREYSWKIIGNNLANIWKNL